MIIEELREEELGMLSLRSDLLNWLEKHTELEEARVKEQIRLQAKWKSSLDAINREE